MKLSSQLPGGSANGLDRLESALLANPHGQQVIILIVDCKQIATDTDSEEQEATARIKRAEWVTDDLYTAQKMFANAQAKRTGQTVLPIEQADEIEEIFAQIIDPTTGEVLGGGDDGE